MHLLSTCEWELSKFCSDLFASAAPAVEPTSCLITSNSPWRSLHGGHIICHGNSGWQHLRVLDPIFQYIEREKTHLCQRVFLLCSFGIIRHPFKFLVDQVPQSLRRDQLQLLHFPEEHGYISSIIFRGAKKQKRYLFFEQNLSSLVIWISLMRQAVTRPTVVLPFPI